MMFHPTPELIKLDTIFLDWVSRQKSCLDDSWHQWDDQRGEGRCIPCHIRRVKYGSGVGIKPLLAACPMTQTQHDEQHRYGELYVLVKYRGWDASCASVEDASDWFETMRTEYLEQWMNESGHNPFFHQLPHEISEIA